MGFFDRKPVMGEVVKPDTGEMGFTTSAPKVYQEEEEVDYPEKEPQEDFVWEIPQDIPWKIQDGTRFEMMAKVRIRVEIRMIGVTRKKVKDGKGIEHEVPAAVLSVCGQYLTIAKNERCDLTRFFKTEAS